eukprot:7166450-Pyramimonas_sp.AAC.1
MTSMPRTPASSSRFAANSDGAATPTFRMEHRPINWPSERRSASSRASSLGYMRLDRDTHGGGSVAVLLLRALHCFIDPTTGVAGNGPANDGIERPAANPATLPGLWV